VYLFALLAALAACSSERAVPGPAVEAAVVMAAEPPPPPPPPEPEAVGRMTLAAVGDIMMHGMVKRSAADARDDAVAGNHEGFGPLFDHVRDQLTAVDVAFGNLETPIAPIHGGATPEMVFNAPPALLPALHDAGFDVVSFANNHVYDQGRAGFIETVEQLTASPLQFAGAGLTCAEARAPALVEHDGVTVAFLAAADLYNAYLNTTDDEPCSFRLDVEQATAAAANARAAGADVVLLSIHWGTEYHTDPDARQRELAAALIEGGVDVILGHHPHVVQPMEAMTTADGRTGLVVYSMGNFLSNQSAWYRPGANSLDAGNPRDGLLLRLDIVRWRYAPTDGEPVEWVELTDATAIPLYTENNTHRRRGGEGVRIRVWPTEARAAAARSAGDAPLADHLIVRAAHLGEIVGSSWLVEGPWSSP
jgi:hypothetical protein